MKKKTTGTVKSATKKTASTETKPNRQNADENVLGMYLNEISRIPLLTREEEDATARLAAEGNVAARDKLINANLRFVVNVAKKFQGQGIPLSDLISEGNIGLIHAVEKFDADRGYRFISYAVWWIRQSILKALCEKSRLIRLPVNRAADIVHIEKAKKELAIHAGGDEELREIAKLLNMNESHVEDMVAISREIVSLEKQVNSGKDPTPLGNFIEDNRYATPDQKLVEKALIADIDELLSTLDVREAEIIRCRYGLGLQKPLSLKEIGERYGLTKERIRQIEQKALLRLQHPSRKSKLESYVA
jgi:RNA polymerase primary sigma factor